MDKMLDLDDLKYYDYGEKGKSPLTFRSLTGYLSAKHGVPKEKVKAIIKDFFRIIARNAKMYTRVSIYGIGTFKKRRIKPKEVNLPGQKRKVKTKGDYFLSFKSSFKL